MLDIVSSETLFSWVPTNIFVICTTMFCICLEMETLNAMHDCQSWFGFYKIGKHGYMWLCTYLYT